MDYPLTYQRISSYDDMDQHLHTIADDILRANRVATYSNHPERERGDLAGPNFGTLIAKDRINYWNKVFDQWHTSDPIRKPKIPDPPKHDELRVSLGYLLQDAPPSRNARRRPKKDPNRRVAQSRLRGAPAYVEPRVLDQGGRRIGGGGGGGNSHQKKEQQQQIQWFWTDEHGKGIDHRITSLYEPKSVTPEERDEALLHALVFRDINDRIHAEHYNMLQTVHWMRCRLMRVLHERYPDMEVVQRPPNVTTADFEKLRYPLRLAPPMPPDRFLEVCNMPYERWQYASDEHKKFISHMPRTR